MDKDQYCEACGIAIAMFVSADTGRAANIEEYIQFAKYLGMLIIEKKEDKTNGSTERIG